MIHSSRRDRKTKAIAEALAMIADAHPELDPHRPRPVRETDEWLWESATEFCAMLDHYAGRNMLPKLQSLPDGMVSPIQWASLVVSGRKRLRNDSAPKDAGVAAAANTKYWAIPAVYMRTVDLSMRKTSPKLPEPERQKIIAKLAGLREERGAVLPMSVPAHIKKEMLDAFDKQIQEEEQKLL
jgi:hypothetical protein